MSVFSSNTEHPDLTYYQNEKENAIAPIITGKGATAVQKQINETFIETVAQTALDAFQIVSSAAQEAGDDSMVDHLIDNLNHNVSIHGLLNPTDRINRILEKHRAAQAQKAAENNISEEA